MCAILGCAAQVCLLAAVLCGSPTTVCPYPMSTAGGLSLWVVCALYLSTHKESPPAVDIGYGQTVTRDPHRTVASRHT